MGRVQGVKIQQPTSKRTSVFDSSSSDDSHDGHSTAPSRPSAPSQHLESKDSDQYEASHKPAVGSPPPVAFPPTANPQKKASSLKNSEVPHLLPDDSPVNFPPKGSQVDLGSGQRASPALFAGYSWTTGLFDCHEHPTNAFFTAILPCVTFGQIVEILEGGDISCALGSLMYVLMAPALCSQCIMGTTYRAKLRKRYNLVQAPTEDWIAHLCCPFCALCQEFRELRNRGIDPSLGWLGNLAQQHGIQQQSRTVPPLNQSMTR